MASFLKHLRANRETFDSFTERARITLFLAERFVTEQGVQEISPEHILRGMACTDAGVGRTALQAMGVDLPLLMPEILALVPPRRRQFAPEQLAELLTKRTLKRELAPQGKGCLTAAREAAATRGHNYVGTEHLLLGLIKQESAASTFLLDRGVTYERAVEEVEKVLGVR